MRLAAYYLSEVFIDGLLLRYYQKRLQLDSAEKLIDEIDKLPISLPLKIQLKWSIIHNPIHKGIKAN